MEGGRWRQEEKERKEMMNFIRIIYSIRTIARRFDEWSIVNYTYLILLLDPCKICAILMIALTFSTPMIRRYMMMMIVNNPFMIYWGLMK